MDEIHPEATCQRCGRDNIVWNTPNEVWNRVMPDDGGILCPVCFVQAAERAGITPSAWRLAPGVGAFLPQLSSFRSMSDHVMTQPAPAPAFAPNCAETVDSPLYRDMVRQRDEALAEQERQFLRAERNYSGRRGNAVPTSCCPRPPVSPTRLPRAEGSARGPRRCVDVFAIIGVVCAYCGARCIRLRRTTRSTRGALSAVSPSASPRRSSRRRQVTTAAARIVHLPVISYPPIEQCTHPLHHRTLHVDAESDAQALDAITRRVR